METVYENQVKAQTITEIKFNQQATEYLSKMESFKKLEKKMKQYESNIKNYMIDNNIKDFTNEVGSFTIVKKKVSMLNRTLIEDIEQYYEETQRKIMYKSVI